MPEGNSHQTVGGEAAIADSAWLVEPSPAVIATVKVRSTSDSL